MAAKKGVSARKKVAKRPVKKAQRARSAPKRAKKASKAKAARSAPRKAARKAQSKTRKGVGKVAAKSGSRKTAARKRVALAKPAKKRVTVAKPAKKKAAGTKPAARKAAKKTTKTIAAKKTAPIVQLPTREELPPSKPVETAPVPTAAEAVQPPISLPAAWPFPMGNRS